MTPNKILITGATGFIGTRFCERLKLLHRLPYRAIVRNFTRANRIARLDAEMFGGDLMKPDSIAKALEGCDCVVHMAHGDDATGPTETKNLIAAALAAKVRRFVHLSSMAVHGPQPGPECAREDTATIGRYNSTYSDSKAEVEELVQKSIRRDSLPAIILRPTIVFGPYSGFVMSVVNAARSGEISLIDDGAGLCNAVFVDDVCSAIHTALTADAGVGEAFFVNADKAVPWREFNLTFAKLVNPNVKVTNFDSSEVAAYWAARRPTFRSNVKAFTRLLASPEFHRFLSTVPALRDTIRWTKQTLKKNLSGETVVALKRTGGGATGPAAAEVKWPDEGRMRRECFPVEFSNEKARRVLGWKPSFTFQQGAAVTKQWLEFARYLPEK